MAKKTKEMPPTEAPEPAAIETVVERADTEALQRPDPTLLGVSVPLNLTFAATKQIMDAWRECLLALGAVIKARARATAAPVAEPVETPTVTA